MLQKNKSNRLIFGLPKPILLGFYIISVIAIFFIMGFFINFFIEDPGFLLVFLSIPYLIITILIGAFLYVLSYIPSNLAHEFDRIKNAIAIKEINTPEAFAEKISLFLCDFFNFIFFDIEHSFVKIKNSNIVYSNKKIQDDLKDKIEHALHKSKQTKEVFYIGKLNFLRNNYFLYIIPIWFGGNWYGFFGVLTRHKLWNVFKVLLDDFEDDFVDDQLIHVLNNYEISCSRELFQDTDVFSKKITQKKYKFITEYQKDLLKLIIDKNKCFGGIFKSIYSKEWVHYLDSDLISNSQLVIEFCSKLSPPDYPHIYHDCELIEFIYIYTIPVGFKERIGLLYLFDNTNIHFERFENIIKRVMEEKVFNDLENLAIQLKLKRIN